MARNGNDGNGDTSQLVRRALTLFPVLKRFNFQRYRRSLQGRRAYTFTAYASWGICSIVHQKKSVFGGSIPNRLSLEATCPRWYVE